MTLHSLSKKQDGSALVIVLIVAVVAVLGGVGAYVYSKQSKDRNNNSTATGARETDRKSFKEMTGTNATDIKAMVTAAQAGEYDVTCNFVDDAGKPAKIYLSGADKMRVDLTINNKAAHFMRLSDKAYIWADGEKDGSLLPFTNSSSSTVSTDKFTDNVDKYKIECKSVKHVDASLFNLPSDVNFIDINAKLKSSTTN